MHGFTYRIWLAGATLVWCLAFAEVLAEETAASRADAPRKTTRVEVETVRFNGIELGVSTIDDVHQTWGQPVSTHEHGRFIEQAFRVEPFEKVELTFYQNKVISIVISLVERFEPDDVARQLDLEGYQPVVVRNPHGAPLGQAWPERGVIFTFAAGHDTPKVAQIVLEVIDAQPFVLRAEERLRTRYADCLDDLATALTLDPQQSRAHWLKAQLLKQLGRRDDALEACQKAVELDPKNPEYRLTLGELWAVRGDYEQALGQTEEALRLAEKREEVKARALCLLGDYLATGPRRDFRQALDFHLQAIRAAEPLLDERRVAVRRAAKEVLVDAHLAVAYDIAWGDWETKAQVAPRWLDRAGKLARESVLKEELSADYEWRLCQQALAIQVGLRGALDPKPWVENLLRLARQRIDAADDPLRRRYLEWELGLGLYDALQVYHARGEAGPSLEYGALAVSYLEKGQVGRQEAPGDAYLMGRLYFRVGWVYAVQQSDHARAVAWFDRAVPLVEREIPQSALADRGRQGETLVSMAVSYWSVGQRERALHLTDRGAELMKQAVGEGILPERALAVPYANLASMHRQLGDHDAAHSFATLAERFAPSSGTKLR